MKNLRTLCLTVVLIAIPEIAPAAPSMTPMSLGGLEAGVNFCKQVDPKSAAKYDELDKKYTEGMTDKEIAEARAERDYKDTYAQITDVLKKIPADKAVETCRGLLESPSN
jgi:hypothetical protein